MTFIRGIMNIFSLIGMVRRAGRASVDAPGRKRDAAPPIPRGRLCHARAEVDELLDSFRDKLMAERAMSFARVNAETLGRRAAEVISGGGADAGAILPLLMNRPRDNTFACFGSGCDESDKLRQWIPELMGFYCSGCVGEAQAYVDALARETARRETARDGR